MFKYFEVSNVLGPDYVHTSNLFNTFMNTATANAIIVQYPSVGDTFDFGTGSFYCPGSKWYQPE